MSRRVGFQTDRKPDISKPSNDVDPWKDILNAGEKILWQGRPDARFRFQSSMLPITLFGMAFAGFALFWMIMASLAGGFFWMFGLIHFSAGVGMIVFPLIAGPRRRSRTWYTLTNHRAIIATDTKATGRKMLSYPITKEMSFEFQEAEQGSIYFGLHDMPSKIRMNGKALGPRKAGFEYIPDAPEVHNILLRIQRDLP